METDIERLRIMGVAKYHNGESPKSICASLNKSKPWLFKWVNRYDPDDPHWYCSRSRRPHHPRTIASGTEDKIVQTRTYLQEDRVFYGAQNILWQLEEGGIDCLPSIRTVNRYIKKHNLVKRRTGRYQPKGKPYPQFSVTLPNQVHQADYLGPRYLTGPIRFYSLNSIDITTKRAAIAPTPNRVTETTLDAFWAIWHRMGIPDYLQLDNELAFRGSNRYPRSLGGIIRLCLLYDIQLIFIPIAEPWRNSVVEKLHEHAQYKWLHQCLMKNWEELREGALAFEHKHNSRYRYSALGGKTPLQALEGYKVSLRFPDTSQPPKKLPKPQKGKIHLIRFIRSNSKLDIFGEQFAVAPELVYEYVKATIDVKEQKLKVYLADNLVRVFDYTMC